MRGSLFFNSTSLNTKLKMFPLVCCSEDGTYAMKKVLIQSKEQLDLVREEIRVSSLFNHPNLLPLLDHAVLAVKVICSALFLCFICA